MCAVHIHMCEQRRKAAPYTYTNRAGGGGVKKGGQMRCEQGRAEAA